MRSFLSSSLLALALVLLVTGCSESLVGQQEVEGSASATIGDVPAERSAEYSKFRHTQLLDRAYSKRGDVASKIDYPTVNLFIGFDEYEMNGVSRRVLDQYGITRRVLDQYGITRRVLDQYGITRRILNEYGITRRILNEYGEVVSETPAIRGRAAYGRAVQGLAVEVEVEFLEDLLAQLEQDPDIDYVEPDPVYEMSVPALLPDPEDSGEMVPWGVERIGGLLTDFSGNDIHIVMMDSGVNENDDVSIDRERDISLLFKDRDREYWDDAEFEQVTPAFEPGDAGNPRDVTGHGTHMASTVAAPKNGKGMRGVAPGARMHNLRVMSEDGRTDITTLTAAIDHITWFKTDVKPDLKLVVNMSLGADIESTQFNALDIAVQRAIDAGIVVVVAAGNDGASASTYSPAHVEDAITVGSFDAFDEFSSFSNHGPAVDLLAPGGDIPALDQNGEYSVLDGTSSAAAYVTGAVAHYWSLNPDATPLEIRDALVASAKPVIAGAPEGTTNRALFIGEFAREWNDDEDFDIDGAEWDPATGTLIVAGVGERLALVDVNRPFTGENLGGTFVGYAAAWSFEASGLDPVPCEIRASSGGVTIEVEVGNAPDGCEQTPAFLKAEFNNGGVLLEATGTANYPVTLTSKNTGTALFSGTFDGNGELSGSFTDWSEVPCVITMSAGPFSADMSLSRAPLNCDGADYLELDKVEYDKGKKVLKVQGTGLPGTPGTSVEIRYADGDLIPGATIVPDSDGGFQLELKNLAEANSPCGVVSAGFAGGESLVEGFQMGKSSNTCLK